MRTERDRFSGLQRVLHWLMAIMVLAMLFIGVSMVSTLKPPFLTLISIHKPLGISILVLAVLRLGVRLALGAPPLPADLPRTSGAGRKALACCALCALDRDAPDRLGDAIRRRLSHRALWFFPSA